MRELCGIAHLAAASSTGFQLLMPPVVVFSLAGLFLVIGILLIVFREQFFRAVVSSQKALYGRFGDFIQMRAKPWVYIPVGVAFILGAALLAVFALIGLLSA